MTWPLSQDYNEAIQNPATLLRRPRAAPRRGGRQRPRPARCPAPATSPTSTRSAAPTASAGPSSASPARCRPARALPGDQPPPPPGQAALHGRLHLPRAGHPRRAAVVSRPEDAVGRGPDAQRVRRPDARQAGHAGGAVCRSGCAWRSSCARREVAHGDLQHGNVLLVPGASANSLAVKLIDYDGMCVPALAGSKSGEVGHPAYQHPQRLREETLQPRRGPLPAPGDLHGPARLRSRGGRCGTSTTTATTCCSGRPT